MADSRGIISKLVKYMQDQGLVFNSINLEDSSPYAILVGKTSIGYRDRSKWNRTGIVFFCTETDARNITKALSIPAYENSDRARPYAVFVTDKEFRQAVDILKSNPLNVMEGTSVKTQAKRSKNESYQNQFWDEYFPHVKKCLARDGYSNSDSNTETTVRDTFYLERKDSRDFLKWFENAQTVAEAKKRIIELLTQANRRSSNLKNDIKYYSRDIDYFAEFYWSTNEKEDEEYSFVRFLSNKNNVSLIRDNNDGELYVRKAYSVFNEEVFNRLKDANIEGLPKIIEVERQGNTLYTIEEYIEGDTLLESLEKKGVFNEKEIRCVAVKLCEILKKLHGMNPQLLHRDIKPSNIILSTDSEIYLIDFNASKEVHGNSSEDTVLYGTQYFAAPEQLIGYMASTAATDVFGLGATLSYLMTGMYHSQAIAIGRYNKIFKKCVEMNPKDRYQSIEEFERAFLDA